ncbi:hypothetical protein BJ741DRAFT_606878, partial [Chytriomyces cf. hyalinus JEL632]
MADISSAYESYDRVWDAAPGIAYACCQWWRHFSAVSDATGPRSILQRKPAPLDRNDAPPVSPLSSGMWNSGRGIWILGVLSSKSPACPCIWWYGWIFRGSQRAICWVPSDTAGSAIVESKAISRRFRPSVPLFYALLLLLLFIVRSFVSL